MTRRKAVSPNQARPTGRHRSTRRRQLAANTPRPSASGSPVGTPTVRAERPPRPAGARPNPTANGDRPASGPADTATTAGGPGANKRRRGSRGGRKRTRPDGERSPESQQEYDRRPGDLPDPPYEGVPSAEAAARVTVYPNDPGGSGPTGTSGISGTSGRSDAEGEAGQPRADTQPREPGSRPRSANKRRRPPQQRADGTEGADDNDATELATVASSASPASTASPASAVEGGDTEAERRPRRPARGGGPSRGPRDPGVDDEASARRRGLERNGRPLGRYLMCVHTRPEGTQIAVLEGRSLIEHYVSRPSDNVSEIHGNIYVGRVQNVLPGMEAAFVDIATPKNAVLYRGDLSFDSTDVEGSGKKSDLRIEQILKNSQLVLCQVTKNPIGSKGARLTQEVSLPGRFVVLVPNSDTYGISKRLADDERKRLRRILDTVKPEGHGLIVRTAAEGATPDELQRDVQMLLRQWADIDAKYKKAKGPALLYKEPDMAVRVIREEFNRNYRGVVIDDRTLYEEVRSYVEGITPELADRVEFFDRETEPLPLFEKQHVHEQLHKAIDRKVWLPSGGSLIIERTEALTVIDVNTGKNVGSSSLEETVFRNNLEAADEIARQLRLRDIGGIIVIDFIDMETRANRDAVIHSFRDSLARDKTRTQVFDISELGLVEMTRKRISEGLVESLSTTCPECGGRGFVFDQALLAE